MYIQVKLSHLLIAVAALALVGIATSAPVLQPATVAQLQFGTALVQTTEAGVLIQAGKSTVTLSPDGNVTISAHKDLKLTANGDIVLEAGRDLSATGGRKLSAQAGQDATITSGRDMTVRGQTNLQLNSNGQLKMQGSTTELRALGINTILGAPIRLN